MKSKMKRRMLAIVLCMVIALSNSSFIFASSGTEEPAAVAQEGDPQNVQETQTEAAVQDTPAVLSETTPEATPEATPEPTQVPEVTAAPTEAPQATAEPTQAPEVTAAPEATPAPTEAPAVTVEPTQAPEVTAAPETTPEATPVPTEAPVTYNEAVELRHEFKDENGNVTATVTAQIPAGAFQSDASELTMEVTVPDQATTEHVKKLMEESLPEHYMLGDTVLYDIRFKVNGTETESQQPIAITFENQSGITVKDVKKAVVFQLDPADPAVEGDKDELVTITQRNDMIESLQNSGQSTDNVDDYDLSEITLKEDGTSNKIQMEGRTSTIYGCYAYYEPVQVLTYEDDQVTVTVSAAENGVIPANAELKVVPITEDKETEDQYKDVEKKLQEKAEEEEYEIAGFMAYDITFVDPDGNETEPNGEVKVSIDYKEAAIPESVSEEDAQNAEVTVMHLEEDENGDVAQVVDMAQVDQMDLLEKTDDQKIQKVAVKTESFSTFTITWTTTGTKITIHYVNRNYQEIAAEGIQDITISDNETIDISKYKKTISNYRYSEATIGRNGSTIYSVRVDESGQLQYKTSSTGKWKDWTSELGYHVYLQYNSAGDDATIETVDNKSENITLNLFNYNVGLGEGKETSTYSGRHNINNGYNKGINEGHDFKFLSSASDYELDDYNKYTGSDSIGQNNPRTGIVRSELVNGYPVGAKFNGSLDYLFNDTKSNAKDTYLNVNHLFTKDEDGYYSYDSNKNAAKFNKNKNEFVVYNQPEPNTHQGFFPFDEDWVRDTAAGKADHYFGLTMSASFYLPEDGKINGNDMVFEFSGDDDVWVFIDDQLVLDLGGIHQEVSGSINFNEFTIKVNDKAQTKKLDEIIDDLTPYSYHTIKFFYLERGNSYSNCKLKFNLPTIPENSVMVTKEVTDENGDKVAYADNISYQFNLTKQGSVVADTSYDIWENNQKVDTGTTDQDGNFTLKHGQSAVFGGFSANEQYVVKEIAAYLEDGYVVEINEEETNIETEDGDGTVTGIYQSASTGTLTVFETPSVVFKNKVKETGTLSITKKIEGEGENEKEFDIEIKINGTLYTGNYSLNGGPLQLMQNGHVGIEANDTIKITGLPYGTTFEVKEGLDGSYLPTYTIDGEGIYDVAVPSEENKLSSAQGKIAAGGTVTITNKKVKIETGTTTVKVQKTWDNCEQYEIPEYITVQLYTDTNWNNELDEGDTPTGYVTKKLNAQNNWSCEWENLPADTNFVVKESYPDGYEKFDVTVSNTLKNIVGGEEKHSPNNAQTFNLGKNNILLVKQTGSSSGKDDRYFLWTPVNLNLSQEEINEIVIRIKPQLSGAGNISLNNVTYQYGQGESNGINLEKLPDDSGWKLSFDYTSTWSLFWDFKYDRTQNINLVNTIDEDFKTEVNVKKIWNGEKGQNVTVELVPKVDGKDLTAAEINWDGNLSITLDDNNDWKYVYENLPYYYYDSSEEKYKIIEYEVTERYINDSIEMVPGAIRGGYIFEVKEDSKNNFTIVNTKIDQWKIYKASETNEQIPLAGAIFTLSKEKEETPSYYGASDITGDVTWYKDISSGDPPAVMYLEDGTYQMEEIKAPSGYQKSDEIWTIVIENYQLKSITNGDQPIQPMQPITRETEVVKRYAFTNKPLYDLPSAGGSGIFWYLISGTAFLMAASLILYRMKRKEVLERK